MGEKEGGREGGRKCKLSILACRYGQEDKLVNMFGIMQALISFVQDDKDVLRYVGHTPFTRGVALHVAFACKLLCNICSMEAVLYNNVHGSCTIQ